MLYQAYQAQSDIMVPVRAWAAMAVAAGALAAARRRIGHAQSHRRLRADRARRPHARAPALRHRPSHGRQPRSRSAGRARPRRRRSARCCISRRTSQRRSRACSLVAPLSGHFATLLRETVRTMLPEHDVFITDWHNARDVPLTRGPLRLRRICRAPDQVSRGHGAGRPRARGLPALRRRACGRGA